MRLNIDLCELEERRDAVDDCANRLAMAFAVPGKISLEPILGAYLRAYVCTLKYSPKVDMVDEWCGRERYREILHAAVSDSESMTVLSIPPLNHSTFENLFFLPFH